MEPDYDVLIIGSGFGGSVTALRLTEKGYRVGVLEAGRRFADEDMAKTSWNLRKFLWAPKFGMYGIQRIHLLRNVMILAGAGVGGGSLNYANTLYVPSKPFFEDKQWSHITDWKSELLPHYDQAKRMLGVVTNPTFTDADRILKEVADDMGCGDTFVPTPVGVFFGPDGKKTPGQTVPDPYFGGAGPDRTGCLECGSCMTGCRFGAKNTLLKNYLGLAESNGADVIPMTTVTNFEQRKDGIWEVRTARTGRALRRKKRTFTAKHVVLAAGTWGTQQLLFKMRDKGKLPELSQRLGELTRTNSESIVGAGRLKVSDDLDLTHGVAITSSIHPSSDTHIEPCRYGKGSNAMGLLQTLMTDGPGEGGSDVPRWRQLLDNAGGDPRGTLRLLNPRRWSERTMIALVMQNLDNSITTYTKRTKLGRRRVVSKQGHGVPNPSWIPAGNEATRRIAEKIDGVAGGTWGELFNIPLTAHYLGGAPIGDSREAGVIDPYHRAYGYPTLFVVDGAAISANLGVNPSLSITAQAERAASLWPNKGENDSRPSQGEAYRRLDPIAPAHPVVPESAPGALRWLPIESIDAVKEEESPGGDDAERSDAEERRIRPSGDDAERSDAEERRIRPSGDDAERSDAEERRIRPSGDDAERSDAERSDAERSMSPGSVSSAG